MSSRTVQYQYPEIQSANLIDNVFRSSTYGQTYSFLCGLTKSLLTKRPCTELIFHYLKSYNREEIDTSQAVHENNTPLDTIYLHYYVEIEIVLSKKQ